MMQNAMKSFVVLMVLALVLAACGGGDNQNKGTTDSSDAVGKQEEKQASSNEAKKEEEAVKEETVAKEEEVDQQTQNETRIVKYLDEEFELPVHIERIVITGAVEAMEDAIVLDVQPIGAITFAGEFPPLFKSITSNAVSIGEKTEPNFESILALKPDVILGSSKFPEETVEKLRTIAPTILYSHISTNWEANLRLLGELSGKEAEAEAAIADYQADLVTAQAEFGDKLADKDVVVVRVRGGNMNIYPANVYFNPVLYEDLSLKVPDAIEAAQAQEIISVEQFAQMNPDYLFVQFETSENLDTPSILEELQNNPIIRSASAIKEGRAFINVVDPLAQGGTAYSKISFLKAVVNQLSK